MDQISGLKSELKFLNIYIVDGSATFANANVSQINVVAKKVARKVAGSTYIYIYLTSIVTRTDSGVSLCTMHQLKIHE